MLVSLLLLLIGSTNFYNLLFLLSNYTFIIVTWLKIKKFKLLFLRVSILKTFHFEVLFFGVLVFIFAPLVVGIFFCANRIRDHWSWKFSSGVFENCLWAVFKPDIHIFSPCRFVEGRGEGSGWVFRLVHINLSLCFI